MPVRAGHLALFTAGLYWKRHRGGPFGKDREYKEDRNIKNLSYIYLWYFVYHQSVSCGKLLHVLGFIIIIKPTKRRDGEFGEGGIRGGGI